MKFEPKVHFFYQPKRKRKRSSIRRLHNFDAHLSGICVKFDDYFYPMKKEISLLINRSEIAAGTRGASMGTDALMAAARSQGNGFFARYPKVLVTDRNELLDEQDSHPFAKRIHGFEKVYANVASQVSACLSDEHFPLVLAGDHASASGTIAGIKEMFPDKRLGVVWIDAHADLHTPYTTPSGNMHGMPLAIALCEDNIACKSNEVDNDTLAIWERLKQMGYSGPKLLTQDLVFIALRDFEAQESALIDEHSISVIPVEQVNEEGTGRTVERTLSLLSDCEILYISFDVDSMDPALTSMGTGTPVKNGLSPQQAKEILVGLCQDSRVICTEFVEINPCLDEKMNRMAEIAFGLLEAVTGTIENRN
jgi:arginase